MCRYKINLKDPINDGKLLVFHSNEFPSISGGNPGLISFIDKNGEQQTWAADLLVNIKDLNKRGDENENKRQ